jgi:DNA-binding beta-propeller fold protein YncE
MRRIHAAAAILIALSLWLAIWVAPADAFRPLVSEAFLETADCRHCEGSGGGPQIPPPEGQLEDPCGLAIAPGGEIYVADYYHRVVDVFGPSGNYVSQIILPGGPISGLGINRRDGVCGLAIDSAGAVYANEWHQGVVRLGAGGFRLDSGESTGITVDAAGDVFVDDRTYIAEYAAPVAEGDPPTAIIGQGSLGDGYGIADAADGSHLYVADAAAGEVKVYEPAVPSAPPGRIVHAFVSLVDSALAIDPTDGHLLVLDDLQPGYQEPEAAVDEFESGGAFVGQVKGPAGAPIVDGEPSGLAVDPVGDLFVTDGNGELSNAFKFGPDPPGEAPAEPLATVLSPPLSGAAQAAPAAAGAPTGAAAPQQPRSHKAPAAKASEVVQNGGVRVSVAAAIAPRRLPRRGSAPIHFTLDTKIASVDGSVPPQLRRIAVKINRNGHLEPSGLPVCDLRAIQPATTAGALAACRPSLVGEGHFTAKVLIAGQSPFPSEGKIVAFNGRWHGRPAILAHVYGEAPLPASYTLPFVIGSAGGGTYGTTLSASLPEFTSKWGYVTGISLRLGRSFRSHGTSRSYLTAACPAPEGFPGATFQLSRATLGFAGRKPITQTLTRSCQAR